jgi:L-seryl-tRNA(Ser) seleniumtransferase
LQEDLLRSLPSVDEALREPTCAALVDQYGRLAVVEALRLVLAGWREIIKQGAVVGVASAERDLSALAEAVAGRLAAREEPSLRAAVNATGIILHTGLGRAVLAPAAVEAVAAVARGYCTLAADRVTGQRISRDTHLAGLLRTLTGAEAATVANNNAAATMLILNTLAAGREVIVSRGQLVEIGGSFRLPDVMAASGAILREVGTTNKTHLRDYAAAINEHTAALMRVHQSNFRIVGFTEEPALGELVGLAHAYNLPVIDDLGSGALVDLRRYGVGEEPLVQESVQAGADVVCFSGDKLIGGPQAGIIVGNAEIVGRIKENQLARALRVDKMTVAALEATLRLFLHPDRLTETHPTYRMLAAPVAELERRAAAVAQALGDAAGHAEFAVVESTGMVGSGTSPTEQIPSRALSVRPRALSTQELARRLRAGDPPIYPRVQHDAVLLDFRTVFPEEESALARRVRESLEALSNG